MSTAPKSFSATRRLAVSLNQSCSSPVRRMSRTVAATCDPDSHVRWRGSHAETSAEFLPLNPNNKIPAIIDPDGPGGKPLALWESGAILIYLADKTGQLLPADAARRYETIQWLMFQMGGIGPFFGQVGFFVK